VKHFWILFLTSCTPWLNSPDILSPPDLTQIKGKEVVVMVHGYYGSALRDPGGKRRFLSLPPIVWGNFEIAFSPENLGLMAPPLEVEGMISHFPIVPFYSIDVYGEGLRALEKENRIIIPFSYDWRQDLVQSAHELVDFLQKIENEEPAEIHVLAHSMGGLVALYALGYGKQEPFSPTPNWNWKKVKTLSTLGSPFQGAMSILRNMQVGTGYPWNPALLEPDTVASFPASYYILPLLNAEFWLENSLSNLPLHKISLWQEGNLGLLKQKDHPLFVQRLAYTKKYLDRAYAFQTALQKNIPKIRILNAVGANIPTLTYGIRAATNHWHFRENETENYSALLSEGDGTVPVSSASLPKSWAVKTVSTTYTHDKVFLDPQFLHTFEEWKEQK
jgi:pimeloyl-ACP methyl ester carboxylesterase